MTRSLSEKKKKVHDAVAAVVDAGMPANESETDIEKIYAKLEMHFARMGSTPGTGPALGATQFTQLTKAIPHAAAEMLTYLSQKVPGVRVRIVEAVTRGMRATNCTTETVHPFARRLSVFPFTDGFAKYENKGGRLPFAVLALCMDEPEWQVFVDSVLGVGEYQKLLVEHLAAIEAKKLAESTLARRIERAERVDLSVSCLVEAEQQLAGCKEPAERKNIERWVQAETFWADIQPVLRQAEIASLPQLDALIKILCSIGRECSGHTILNTASLLRSMRAEYLPDAGHEPAPSGKKVKK